MSEAQTADPIPEAPADEEVEGPQGWHAAIQRVRDQLGQAGGVGTAGVQNSITEREVGGWVLDAVEDELTALSLRSRPETDKPGVREAALETVRAHKHTCANVQPGSTHADKCDCGALDTAGQVIPRSTTGGAK